MFKLRKLQLSALQSRMFMLNCKTTIYSLKSLLKQQKLQPTIFMLKLQKLKLLVSKLYVKTEYQSFMLKLQKLIYYKSLC